MANRLILGLFTTGDWRLRISNPGFNAASVGTAAKNIAFDSTWAGSSAIFMSGTITFPNNNVVNVNFGTTFSAIPIVWIARGRTVSSQERVGGGNVAGWGLNFKVTTSQLQIFQPSDSAYDGDFVRYIVFREFDT